MGVGRSLDYLLVRDVLINVSIEYNVVLLPHNATTGTRDPPVQSDWTRCSAHAHG